MLAPDEEDGTLDALRFDLASDIVELVVLTADETFLQTLREAVGAARRLWHVPTADKVSDLLVAGQVGILVLDVQALNESPTPFIAQIKRQFPDLVVVVAGDRDAETQLAGLISAGTVYRFIHKPMSPGRAKLFADAAVKKYEARRRPSAASQATKPTRRSNRGLAVGGAIVAMGTVVAVIWALHGNSDDISDATRTDRAAAGSPAAGSPAAESPLLAQAAGALAANRLTEPAGDNALELYRQAQTRNPADPKARAGLAEVRERLLARAENALLEEHLDEAAGAIETARLSGVENGRIAFLTAQLAKSRLQVKAAQASAHARNEPRAEEDKVASLLKLATQRINDAQLIEPERDSALFYIQEALRADPASAAAQEIEAALATRLLGEAMSAIDRRDLAHASGWIEAAKAIATPANIEAAQASLATARKQADADAFAQLLKNAGDRLQQGQLIEPAGDSAKYFLLTLRGLDPGNPGLATLLHDLGTRLTVKARLALVLGQYDAARSWLDEAAAIGFTSPEASSVQHDLDTTIAGKQFLANVVAAGNLELVKSVQPKYPDKAAAGRIEGWVELDFTVTDSGSVKDIAVHAASAPGVFENAAISALAQWRYKPVMRDGKPNPQRARVRIRFVLAG